MAERKQWIDVLKGIGIIYVVFGHLAPAMIIEKHIYSFHMMLFFAVSGYLFDANCEYRVFAKKKFKALMISFLAWNSISVIIGYLLFDVSLGASLYALFGLEGTWSWNSPVWFLFILFITENIFYVISRTGKFVRGGVALLCIILGYMFNRHVFTATLHVLPTSVLMMILGKAIRKYNLADKFSGKSVGTQYIFVAVMLLLNVVGAYFNTRVSVYHSEYGNYLLAVTVSVLGILAYGGLALIIKSNGIIEYFGRNSLLLVCVQYYIFKLYQIILSVLFKIDVWYYRSTLKAVILTIVTLILFKLINEIYNRAKFNWKGKQK